MLYSFNKSNVSTHPLNTVFFARFASPVFKLARKSRAACLSPWGAKKRLVRCAPNDQSRGQISTAPFPAASICLYKFSRALLELIVKGSNSPPATSSKTSLL